MPPRLLPPARPRCDETDPCAISTDTKGQISMQACPKCGSSAPDDAQTCSICFAALGSAEPAATFSAPSPEDGTTATATGLSPLGAGVSVPREEDYMPVVGIPGVDNIPKDAPPVYGQPAAAPPLGLGGMPARTTLGGDVIQ